MLLPTLGIDHPLVLVRDIEAMAARYRSLGFNTAPIGRHPWGTSTSLAMFDRQALELMGLYDESLLDSHAVGEFRFGRHMAAALAGARACRWSRSTARTPRATGPKPSPKRSQHSRQTSVQITSVQQGTHQYERKML